MIIDIVNYSLVIPQLCPLDKLCCELTECLLRPPRRIFRQSSGRFRRLYRSALAEAESLDKQRCLLLHLHYSFYSTIFVNEKHDCVFSALNNFSVEVGDFYQYFRGITQVMDSCEI